MEAKIEKPDGTYKKPEDKYIDSRSVLKYLGCHISREGRVSSELGRKLGLAKSDFENLAKVWSHSYISMRKKVRIFEACVGSKLLYGLTSACLTDREDNKSTSPSIN